MNLINDSGSRIVLMKRGVISGGPKLSTSIMVLRNTTRDLAPMYVVYKAENTYPEWIEATYQLLAIIGQKWAVRHKNI